MENIKEHLCYYDKRNPNNTIEEGQENTKKKECYCDNCHNGKTELAERVLELTNVLEDMVVSFSENEADNIGIKSTWLNAKFVLEGKQSTIDSVIPPEKPKYSPLFGTKFARKCDVTGEGMNEGYCINDGEKYIKSHEDMLQHITDETEYKTIEEAYADDYYYHTEWTDEDDYKYTINENGELKETE